MFRETDDFTIIAYFSDGKLKPTTIAISNNCFTVTVAI